MTDTKNILPRRPRTPRTLRLEAAARYAVTDALLSCCVEPPFVTPQAGILALVETLDGIHTAVEAGDTDAEACGVRRLLMLTLRYEVEMLEEV